MGVSLFGQPAALPLYECICAVLFYSANKVSSSSSSSSSSWDYPILPNSKPFIGALNTQGWAKCVIFDLNRHLSGRQRNRYNGTPTEMDKNCRNERTCYCNALFLCLLWQKKNPPATSLQSHSHGTRQYEPILAIASISRVCQHSSYKNFGAQDAVPLGRRQI